MDLEEIEETWSQTVDEEDEMVELEDKLSCVRCGQKTSYDPDITEDQDRFCCDDCLLGFHPGCEEDCEACRSIASISINKNIAQITRSVHAVSEENTSMRMLPTLSQLQFQLVRIHLFSRYTKK